MENTMPSNENKIFKKELLVDGVAGAAAGLVATPFETIKKRLETNQKWNHGMTLKMVRETYRGGTAFIFSVSPVTVMQGLVVNIIKSKINDDKPLSQAQNLTAAASGGIVSSFTENVILRQQKLSSGPIQAISSMLKQYPTRPWLGVSALICRETVFGFSYMNAKKVEEEYGKFAPILLGITGSLVSHPFDRIATENQHLENKAPIYQTGKKILQQGGIKNLYKGGLARIFLFTSCMLTISEIKNIFERNDSSNNEIASMSYR